MAIGEAEAEGEAVEEAAPPAEAAPAEPAETVPLPGEAEVAEAADAPGEALAQALVRGIGEYGVGGLKLGSGPFCFFFFRFDAYFFQKAYAYLFSVI